MFQNREEAGRLLVERLRIFNKKEMVVLAIPRGGVVVGKIIADFFKCPLDVLVVKKLGSPHNPELAIGAVTSLGLVYWDESQCKAVGVSEEYKNLELRTKNEELRKREKYLRTGKKPLELGGKVVILVDDGVATGATAVVAARVVRRLKPYHLVLAVPVIASDTIEEVKKEVDELIYLEAPMDFYAVGQFYKEFQEVGEEEVKRILSTTGSTSTTSITG